MGILENKEVMIVVISMILNKKWFYNEIKVSFLCIITSINRTTTKLVPKVRRW
jgi:hypothetical protein